MPEQFLNDPQISPAVQQMRGKAMPQSVRTHLDGDSRLAEVLLDDPRYAARGNPAAPIVQKNGTFAFAREAPFFAEILAVIPKRIERRLANGHNAFFGPFAHH